MSRGQNGPVLTRQAKRPDRIAAGLAQLRRWRFAVVVIMMMSTAVTAVADQPLGISLPFARRVEWRADADYSLRPEHGPWLIMCAAFIGEAGRQQAHDLVRELRSEHNLEAFIYEQEFDYSGTIEGKGFQLGPDGESVIPQRMRHLHLDQFVEIAVMVGSYESIDSGRTTRALNKIKSIKPQTLEVSETVRTNHRMGVLREIQRRLRLDPEGREKGPMRAAFVTTNPMLPDEYFGFGAVDEWVLSLNVDKEFSLLHCRAPYTVRVATFRGESTFDLDEIEEAEEEFRLSQLFNRGLESKLDYGGEQAHALTLALRERGWEAYEFHDRYESYVCIGAFEWATRPQRDGTDELHPDVYQLMERFKARPQNVLDAQGNLIRGAMQPLSLVELPGIFFDVQPLPEQVPRIPAHLR